MLCVHFLILITCLVLWQAEMLHLTAIEIRGLNTLTTARHTDREVQVEFLASARDLGEEEVALLGTGVQRYWEGRFCLFLYFCCQTFCSGVSAAVPRCFISLVELLTGGYPVAGQVSVFLGGQFLLYRPWLVNIMEGPGTLGTDQGWVGVH